MFKNLKIKILDEQHLTAVCDVLESMGYKKQAWFTDSPKYIWCNWKGGMSGFIHEPSGLDEYLETVTLRDLLQMRDEMVKEKINISGGLPEKDKDV